MTDPAADGAAVLTERHGRVLLVTINRPEARNAVNAAVATGLGDALDEADTDPGIWAVIVTGAGDKAFCAGADLKAVTRGESLSPAEPRRAAWGFAGYVAHPIGKPTISAVNGFALGGGTEIALASDLVVAADTASFGLPEVKRGIYAGAGGVFRLPQQIPKKVAMEMILTGEPVSAARALELGLVNRVVPQARVVQEALALAARVTANAPLAVQASKRIANGIRDGQVAADAEYWELSRAEGRALMTSADAAEGPRAFAEKRVPSWEGR
ncbi:MAG TPA: crotonase/enoyl-CoA hydratase family protein [Streptosporangiaceae bacterium]|nr:crotonase/enoyl-CoA hydratase family protein [Streptosporangiaceae bacterium]